MPRRSLAPDLSTTRHLVQDTAAGRMIAEEIAQRGPITFERFMELALYAPDVGYYARRSAGPGPEADYVTSPEVHAAFGGLVCGQLEEMWEALGRPSPFWIVEGGPGSGQFAADLISAAETVVPNFAQSLHLALIEASPALRARQHTRLDKWSSRVCWLDPAALPSETLGEGCVFGNELLDAFPVHRVVMTAEGLRERYVSMRSGQFHEVDGPLTRPEIARQIEEGGGRLNPGNLAEINLKAAPWVKSIMPLISRGYFMLLDYGEPAPALYGARHPRGTLRCYWRQMMNEEPLCRVGEQDITAHVDLSAVTRAAQSAGAQLLGATSQEALLGRLGLPLLVERAGRAAERRSDEWGHQSALRALVDPEGLGRVSALLFGKSAPDRKLSGFARSDPRSDLAEALAMHVLGGPPRLVAGPIRSGSRTTRSST